MTGRACFERARQCENLTQSQHCLSSKPHPKAIIDAAVPGVPYVPTAGKGQGQPMVPQTAPGIVDPGSWPNATTRPGEVSVPITQEQREANGPCWFYKTGACVRKNCNKAHRIMTVEEKKSISTTWGTFLKTKVWEKAEKMDIRPTKAKRVPMIPGQDLSAGKDYPAGPKVRESQLAKERGHAVSLKKTSHAHMG